MRNFILAGNTSYGSGATALAIANGAVAFAYDNNGVFTVSSNGADLPDKSMLVCGRSAVNGGPVVLPIHKNNFKFVKAEYSAATTFVASITIPAPTKVGDYSVIIAIKGKLFNERNKWTPTVHITDVTTTADALAQKLVTAINQQGQHGIVATLSNATITFTAQNAGVDYEIIPCDLLQGTTVTYTTRGMKGFCDATYIADLAEKAAADAGYEYTYRDSYTYLYPNYPLDPLKGNPANDGGFTIFTLSFAEPRDVKTTDEAIRQIVQVAFPTGAAAIDTFESVCEALAGVASANTASADDAE